MTTRNIPKGDEEELQQLLDDIEEEVRQRYWNGKWKSSGVSVTWHTGMYRGK